MNQPSPLLSPPLLTLLQTNKEEKYATLPFLHIFFHSLPLFPISFFSPHALWSIFSHLLSFFSCYPCSPFFFPCWLFTPLFVLFYLLIFLLPVICHFIHFSSSSSFKVFRCCLRFNFLCVTFMLTPLHPFNRSPFSLVI